MKKIILICLLALVSGSVFGQTVVQRASSANTVSDPNIIHDRSIIIPRYRDTADANTKYATLDSAAKIIYTRSDKSFWYRQDYPKKWVKVVSGNNLSSDFFYDSTCNCYKIDTSALINIINNFNTDSSITSISVVNDSTIQICYGSGNCINIGIVTNITNISNVYFIGGDSIVVCAIDTAGAVVTTVCDTVTIGVHPVTTIFQNALTPASNIVEFGGSLVHPTTVSNWNNKLTWHGYQIYDYPWAHTSELLYQLGAGLDSWQGRGNYINCCDNADANRVEQSVVLGLNYIGGAYSRNDPTNGYIQGYLGDSVKAYTLGANWRPYGSYGALVNDFNSKTTAIALHTTDIGTNYGISFYAAPEGTANVSNEAYRIVGGNGLGDYRRMSILTNGDIQLPAYDSTTRNDGTLTKALGTDEFGNVILGTVSGGGSIIGYNGLTNVGSDSLKVGGTLTETTNIDGASHSFNLTGVSGYLFSTAQVGTKNSSFGQDNTATEILHNEDFDNNIYSQFQLNINGIISNAVKGANSSNISVKSDSIQINPFLGKINIDSLRVGSSSDSVMVWNKQTGAVAYRNASSFGISGITANNGVTASTSTNVQLGGTLIQPTTITGNDVRFQVSRSIDFEGALRTLNTGGSGYGLEADGNSAGVYSTSTNFGVYGIGDAIGVYAQTNNSAGLAFKATSIDGITAYIQSIATSTNTVIPQIKIERSTTGIGANGIGGSIDYYLEGTSGAQLSNQLISKWSDATNATRTSQFIITGVLAGTTGDLLKLNGDKSIQLTPITATAASAITPAEGMILFVSNTNGTFTSIGLWDYENGAWHKL